MCEGTVMNRYSRSSLVALLALVVSISYFSAGCALGGKTGLPELPPVPVFIITTTSVPQGFTGTPYPPPSGPSVALATSGGTPPLSDCSVVNGILPTGLSITPGGSTCLISGTIADPGVVPPAVADPSISCPSADTCNYTFTVRAADSAGIADTQVYTMTVRIGFVVNGFTLGNFKEGTAITPLDLPTTGGTLTGALANCSLSNGPAGLNVTVSGRSCVLSGTPAQGSAGTYPMFTVTATDQGVAGSSSTPGSLTVNDNLAVSTTSLPNGVVNAAYSQTLANTGGQTPFAWSITAGPFTGGVGNAGTPCEGLSLNAGTGGISGTPVNTGTCGFTARVDDTATSSTTSNGTFQTTASTNDTQALSIVVDKANSTTAITSDRKSVV